MGSVQRAKKVVSDSPGIVGLVNSVLNFLCFCSFLVFMKEWWSMPASVCLRFS